MAKLRMADVKVGSVYKMKTDHLEKWGISKGDPVEVRYLHGHNIDVVPAGNPDAHQLGVTVSQLDFYTQKKEQIEKEIIDCEQRIAESKAKLAWMKATNNEEFDEDEFKVWSTLSIIDNPNTTQTEKAKAIAALIKK